MAIVLDLQQLQPTVLDRDLDRSGAGIEGVFNKFLKRVGWSVDNLQGTWQKKPLPQGSEMALSHGIRRSLTLGLFFAPREVCDLRARSEGKYLAGGDPINDSFVEPLDGRYDRVGVWGCW